MNTTWTWLGSSILVISLILFFSCSKTGSSVLWRFLHRMVWCWLSAESLILLIDAPLVLWRTLWQLLIGCSRISGLMIIIWYIFLAVNVIIFATFGIISITGIIGILSLEIKIFITMRFASRLCYDVPSRRSLMLRRFCNVDRHLFGA